MSYKSYTFEHRSVIFNLDRRTSITYNVYLENVNNKIATVKYG